MRPLLIIVYLFFTYQLKAFGQEEKLYISARIGAPTYKWNVDGNFDMLSTQNSGLWALSFLSCKRRKAIGDSD
ncbi:hypothetical protein EL17_19150 [Anditalea andensis]|uniref:Uncharacterized protein n=1 Tax=Anditalea andensis TaxID=1048983 RepID=A0A074KSZ3_9BACT|nr:hypothetical protein EL17_19150 [Anditalea andensis]